MPFQPTKTKFSISTEHQLIASALLINLP